MKWKDERLRMVSEQLRKRRISDERVLHAMEKVPRHLFVPQENRQLAYNDGPLPIGEGQTVSQPYMVAVMTQHLNVKGGEKILEIGTGSGYQSAILMELGGELFTIERIHSLGERAKDRLTELGYKNFHIRIDDGTKGWPDAGPFDGILVTAGAPSVPDVLVEQLNDGGRLVIPVGSRHSQALVTCEKKGEACITDEDIMCVFVPLIGKYGWEDN
jgi:protein-L-isoaspartate(D-aspartate) O-methyltransferase